jgi:hypothetical protein
MRVSSHYKGSKKDTTIDLINEFLSEIKLETDENIQNVIDKYLMQLKNIYQLHFEYE